MFSKLGGDNCHGDDDDDGDDDEKKRFFFSLKIGSVVVQDK